MDNRFFDNAPHAENRAFRRINDRREGIDAEHAEIGNRKRATPEVSRAELVIASVFCERLNLIGNRR